MLFIHVLVVLFIFGVASEDKLATLQRVYFGTQTSDIYVALFDSKDGSLTTPYNINVGETPSWLEYNHADDILYSVNENTGYLRAYKADKSNGNLTEISIVSNFGSATCHSQLDSTKHWLGAVNYGSGSFYLHGVNADGSIVEAPVFSYSGGVHPHQFLYSPDQKFVFVPDLGKDRILQYAFDAASTTIPLSPNVHAAFVSTKSGAGPRHLAFSPAFPNVAYGSNELDSTLNVYSYDSDLGTLTLRQSLSTLPESHDGVANYPAEVMVSPDGHYVYVSNRGNDTIAIFTVELTEQDRLGFVKEGSLSLTSVHGSYPRFIGYDNTARYLFATNQNSNNVAIFKVSGHDFSKLSFVQSVDIPSPQHAYFVTL